jgi:alkanesulfonate monooxygenase SsuD/methylene tetrahydromethanopterin reductase-like flavin-dependent oxidoreductase (luciferase family)
MWVAATSPPSYALAGDYGLDVLAFGMAIDRDAMGRRIAEWRHAMETTTRTISAKNEQFALFMMCYCARTEKEAREMCEEAFVRYLDASVEQFIRWADTGELPPGYEWYAAAAELATQQSGKMKFDYLMENNMLLVGTPKQITSTIKSFEEVGVTQMLVATQLGRIPHQAVLESIRLFGDEVIPNFR